MEERVLLHLLDFAVEVIKLRLGKSIRHDEAAFLAHFWLLHRANSAAQFAFPAATLDLIDSIKGESICGAPERVSEVADPIESAQGYPGGDYGKGTCT